MIGFSVCDGADSLPLEEIEESLGVADARERMDSLPAERLDIARRRAVEPLDTRHLEPGNDAAGMRPSAAVHDDRIDSVEALDRLT